MESLQVETGNESRSKTHPTREGDEMHVAGARREWRRAHAATRAAALAGAGTRPSTRSPSPPPFARPGPLEVERQWDGREGARPSADAERARAGANDRRMGRGSRQSGRRDMPGDNPRSNGPELTTDRNAPARAAAQAPPAPRRHFTSRSISRRSCSKRTGLARMASTLTHERCSGLNRSKDSRVSLVTPVTMITGRCG